MSVDIDIDMLSLIGSSKFILVQPLTSYITFIMTPGSPFYDSLYPTMPLGIKAQPNISCLYALLVKRHNIPDDGWECYDMRKFLN